MVIEWLKFRVTPEIREKFVEKDAEIWTPVLAGCPGFVSKEVWLNPEEPAEVILVIRWASREEWKSISQELLEQTDRQFALEMGATYQIVEVAEYQVRKFPHR